MNHLHRSKPEELFAAGRHAAAAAAFDELPRLTIEQQVLRTILEEHVGNDLSAAQQAESLLERHLTLPQKAWCLSVIARARARHGATDEAWKHFRQAVRLARQQDPVAAARIQSNLTSSLIHWGVIEGALGELPELRRLAYVAADTQALVTFHCCVAEIAIKRSDYRLARRHARIATALASSSGDLWLTSRVCRLKANIGIFGFSPNEAKAAAVEAVDLARQSGNLISLYSSLSSLGHVCLLTGAHDTAERAAREMLDFNRGLASRIAAQDLLMASLLAKGDFKAAGLIGDQIENPKTDGARYYWLWSRITVANLLLKCARPLDAVHLLESLENDVATRDDKNLRESHSFVYAEALAGSGRASDAVSKLCQVVRSLPNLSEITTRHCHRIIASILGRQHDDWQFFQERANGSTELNGFADQSRVDKQISTLALLSGVASIFAMNRNTLSLTQEFFALARATGQVRCGALLVEDSGGARLLLNYFGCTPALAHALSKTTGAIEISVAGSEGRSYSVALQPLPSPDARLTLLVIEQIFNAAKREQSDSPSDDVAAISVDTSVAFGALLVANDSMKHLMEITRRVATSNVTVLFTGETGTGKELLARALHDYSPRKQKPFIPFNVTAIARDMLDSQLFGYKRGAFTGAQEAFPGVIRAANGGTLFLDEIGEMPLDLQPKLLRFLESGEIHPLGEPRPITVDVRIVAATNANLEQLVTDGKFREDLFYRLNVVRLQVPPLRERREEIPLLAQHYIDKFSRESQKTGIRLAEETMEYLVLFKWPGNVRQLTNEIRRMVALAESSAVLMPEHLSREIAASRRTIPASQRDIAPTEFVVRMDQPMPAAIEHLERSMITYAMKIADNRLEDAANLLGLSRKGLYLKRTRLKLDEDDVPDQRQPSDQSK